MKHKKLLGAGVVALSLAAGLATTAGASTDTTEPGGTDSAPSGECETVDEISLRLQWAIQAQFAGYIAARDTGIFERYCLDVEIIETGVDIVPQQDLADGNVDFALAWVPKALATREAGADIVNIAQIFQRSGTLAGLVRRRRDHQPGGLRGAATSATGDSATSTRSSPPWPKPGSIRQATSLSSSSSSTWSACSKVRSTPPRR